MGRGKLYEVLGLPLNATLADIRRAHREKVKARHPDAGGKREDFEQTQQAYMVLRDPELRAKYDETGDIPDGRVDVRSAQIRDIIARQLITLLAQPLEIILPNDALAAIKGVLREEINSCAKADVQSRATIGKIERLRKRFVRKDGSPENLLVQLLDGHKGILEQGIERNIQQRALREEALELLAAYQFDREQPLWVGGHGNAAQGQYGVGGLGLGGGLFGRIG